MEKGATCGGHAGGREDGARSRQGLLGMNRKWTECGKGEAWKIEEFRFKFRVNEYILKDFEKRRNRMAILPLVWKGHLSRGQGKARERGFWVRSAQHLGQNYRGCGLKMWIPRLPPASNGLVLVQALPQSKQFYHAAPILLKECDLLKRDCPQLCVLESPRELINSPDEWLYHLEKLNQHCWRGILGFGVLCVMCCVSKCSLVIVTFSQGWNPLSRKFDVLARILPRLYSLF